MVKIVTRYKYSERQPVRVNFDPKIDKSKTNQADMENTDINKIMARAQNGIFDPTIFTERKATFGDFSEIGDYHTMLSGVRAAERKFGTLPADIRNRFNNDPQELIDFLRNPENDKEAVKLGLKDRSVLVKSAEPTSNVAAGDAVPPAAGASGTGTSS